MPEQQPDKTVSNSKVKPLGLAAVVTGLTVVFGDYAHDVAAWIVCVLSPNKCSSSSQATAVMLGTLVSTFVAIYGTAGAASIGTKSVREAKLAIVGAMIGAFLALLKASVDAELGYPDLSIVGQAILIYFIICFVVFVPFVLNKQIVKSKSSTFKILTYIALAFFSATILGGVFQWIVSEFWNTAMDDRSAKKFVIAPVAPIISMAVFGTLILSFKQSLKSRSVRIGFVTFFCIFAAFSYTKLDYISEHGGTNGWISQSGASSLWVGFNYGLVLLFGIFAVAFSAVLTAGSNRRPYLYVGVFFACLLSYFAGLELGMARHTAFPILATETPIIIASTLGLTPALGLMAIKCAAAISKSQNEDI